MHLEIMLWIGIIILSINYRNRIFDYKQVIGFDGDNVVNKDILCSDTIKDFSW